MKPGLLAALALAAASCGAFGWAIEPAPARIEQSSPAPAQACRCLDQPPPPAQEASNPPSGPSGAGAAATIGTVATVVGIATGNPVAWNLIGMIASHLIGAVGATRRRKTTT